MVNKELDYKAQELVEILYQLIISVSGLLGFIYGYIVGDFYYSFVAVFAGFCVAMVICVPGWNVLNRNPLKWQPAVDTGDKDKATEEEKSSSSSSSSPAAAAATAASSSSKPKTKANKKK